MKKKIGILDLKINNILSIYNACLKANFSTNIINTKEKNYKKKYDIIILPGVGSYKNAMNKIYDNNYNIKILEFLSDNNKILIGICLGMQLLFSNSEEFGKSSGLNLIKGKVKRFDKKIIVPHTGWAKLNIVKNTNFFTNKLNEQMFFFTHSFYCIPEKAEHIISKTQYFDNKFCSAIQKDNIIGMQFHPEKSGKHGIELLKKFERN